MQSLRVWIFFCWKNCTSRLRGRQEPVFCSKFCVYATTVLFFYKRKYENSSIKRKSCRNWISLRKHTQVRSLERDMQILEHQHQLCYCNFKAWMITYTLSIYIYIHIYMYMFVYIAVAKRENCLMLNVMPLPCIYTLQLFDMLSVVTSVIF